jgi:hypothetical protein
VVAAATQDYNQATDSVMINVLKATPVLAWTMPADISYGTALGPDQLDATATYGGAAVAGTFAYTPAAGTVLSAGSGQKLSVLFTPTDTTDFTTASMMVPINVNPLAPAFDSLAAPTITYGATATTLSGHLAAGALIPPGDVAITLNGTTESAPIDPVKGIFSASFPTATLGVSTAPYTITYAYAATTNFTAASATASLTVNKATPTITWANPADIVYGTPLGAAQLDATASVAGSFAFTPAGGTVLNAGQGQTLRVTFTPADPADFNAVDASASINVTPAPLTVRADDVSQVEGAGTPSFTAHYAGFVNGDGPSGLGGTLTFTTPASASSPPGQYPITPGGLTAANYAITYRTGTLTVTPSPMPTPAPVTVLGIEWESRKLSRKKTTKVLVVSFSGALEQGPAENLADYHLAALGKAKKSGGGASKSVALASAVYDPATDTVTLTPRGTVPKGTLQLTINAAGTLDAEGRPIVGNQGSNVVATFGSGGGVSLARAGRPGPSIRVSAEAFDALMVEGHFEAMHGLPRGTRLSRR